VPILKAPPKQPKNATLQLRLDEELKIRLDEYAEFLDSTESYVVSEALELVFNKDAEFKALVRHRF
jgi:predicted transcriptional regulator